MLFPEEGEGVVEGGSGWVDSCFGFGYCAGHGWFEKMGEMGEMGEMGGVSGWWVGGWGVGRQ